MLLVLNVPEVWIYLSWNTRKTFFKKIYEYMKSISWFVRKLNFLKYKEFCWGFRFEKYNKVLLPEIEGFFSGLCSQNIKKISFERNTKNVLILEPESFIFSEFKNFFFFLVFFFEVGLKSSISQNIGSFLGFPFPETQRIFFRVSNSQNIIKYNNWTFKIGTRKLHFPKYKESFGGWNFFCFSCLSLKNAPGSSKIYS